MFGPSANCNLPFTPAEAQDQKKDLTDQGAKLLKSSISPALSEAEKKFLQEKGGPDGAATVEAAKKVVTSFDNLRTDPLKRVWYEQALFVLAKDTLRSQGTAASSMPGQEQESAGRQHRGQILRFATKLSSLLNAESSLLKLAGYQEKQTKADQVQNSGAMGEALSSITTAVRFIQQLIAKATRRTSSRDSNKGRDQAEELDDEEIEPGVSGDSGKNDTSGEAAAEETEEEK